MAQGYKGFEQIARQANRNIEKLKKVQELNEKFDRYDTVDARVPAGIYRSYIAGFKFKDEYDPKAIIATITGEITVSLSNLILIEKRENYSEKFGYDFELLDELHLSGFLDDPVFYKQRITDITSEQSREWRQKLGEAFQKKFRSDFGTTTTFSDQGMTTLVNQPIDPKMKKEAERICWLIHEKSPKDCRLVKSLKFENSKAPSNETDPSNKLIELIDFMDSHNGLTGILDGGRAKHNFSIIGKQAFRELGKLLHLKKRKVQFFHDLPSSSGTVQLKGMINDHIGIKISLNTGGMYKQNGVIHTLSDMDEKGRGPSQLFDRSILREPSKFNALVDRLTTDSDENQTKEMKLLKLQHFSDFLSKYGAIDGYKEGGKVKSTFGKLGKQAFKELAEFLGLKEYQVKFNKAGDAVSGEVQLYGMYTDDSGIYIHYNRDFFPAQVLYRTISSLKDFSGGSNHYFNDDHFGDPYKIKETIDQLISSKPENPSTTNNSTEKENPYKNPEFKPGHSYDLHFKIWDSTQEQIIQELNQLGLETNWAKDKAFFIHLSYQEAKQVEEVSNKNGSILFLDREYLSKKSKPEPDQRQDESPTNTVTLWNDDWFKKNQAKVLGETYTTKDEYGKSVERVKGTIDNVIHGLDVPAVELPQEMDSPLLTEIKPLISENSLDAVQRANLDKVIRFAKENHAQEAMGQIKKEIGERGNDPCPDGYYCFEDILNQYNQGISEEEIKAWVWYKRVSGGYKDEKVILHPDNGWSKYATSLAQQDTHLKDWVNHGIVCFDGNHHIPSSLYYAENIYQRQSELLAGKQAVIKAYGEEQFERQWTRLESIRPPKLSLANPDQNKRLVLNPKSSFAKESTVLKLHDGTIFREEIGKTGKFKDQARDLLEVFREWLKDLPKNSFKISNAHRIGRYYLDDKIVSGTFDKDEKKRIKRNAKLEGSEFFGKFLADAISRDDQLKIEQSWNSIYNSYVEINYFKIPVAFTCSKTFKNKPLFLREAQREGLGFISVHGIGCIAYDVGVGKTMTAILSLAQMLESGECKRPLVVVPNATYSNWLAELRGAIENGEVILTGILPQYPVNDLYNLGTAHIDGIMDSHGQVEKVAENTITVLTYEGFNQLGLNQESWEKIGTELFGILNQGGESQREEELLWGRIEEMMGHGSRGGMVNIEDLGFDSVVFDEVHNMKKSFTRVRGESKADGKRTKVPYQIQSGQASMIGLRAFMISQYILRNNNMRNVVGLSATPFTNSPLEIYSMLALFAFHELEKYEIKNIKDFFDQFIKTSVELTVNSKLQPERREVILGFNNLIALQQLVFRFINYKTGEDANIERPNKIVLPRVNQKQGNELIPLPPEQQISTSLPMTMDQQEFMTQIELYVRGGIELMELCVNDTGAEEEEGQNSGELIELPDEEEKDRARILRALSFASQLALSPYLYACNPAGEPTAKEFVEESPKFRYAMLCIESIRTFCDQNELDMPGQVIYSNAGVHYFKLVKEYLVKHMAFQENQIGIIRGGLSAVAKDSIKNKFNAGQIKVLIGSASIKEGINLQFRSSDLYDLWLDWNPTDVKQLEGRIWRPGNIHRNVRITFPLMENSIDIFKFQKLQEKTSRINEIWHRSNTTNTLKLEEFNPAELKRALITDPSTLAELLVLEEKENLKDQVNSLTNQKEVLKELNNARETFNKNVGHIKAAVEKYKPRKEGQAPRKIETIFKLYKDWIEDSDTETYLNDEHIFNDTRKANYRIQSGIREILAPRGLNINFDFQRVVRKLDQEMEDLQSQLIEKTGKEAIREHIEVIREEREKLNYKSATVEERVVEFSQLNQQVLTELHDSGPVPKAKVIQKPKSIHKPALTIEQEHIRIQKKARERRLKLIEMELELAA